MNRKRALPWENPRNSARSLLRGYSIVYGPNSLLCGLGHTDTPRNFRMYRRLVIDPASLFLFPFRSHGVAFFPCFIQDWCGGECFAFIFFLISFQLLEFRERKKPGDGQAFLGVDELWKV